MQILTLLFRHCDFYPPLSVPLAFETQIIYRAPPENRNTYGIV